MTPPGAVGSEWLLFRAAVPELLLYWVLLVVGMELLLFRVVVP